jgi:hypothetical protein
MRTMRTTVTIDADTELLLKEEAARTGQSFKQVLNGAVRRALGGGPGQVVVSPLFDAPFPSGLGSFNRLADAWDDDDTLRELQS